MGCQCWNTGEANALPAALWLFIFNNYIFTKAALPQKVTVVSQISHPNMPLFPSMVHSGLLTAIAPLRTLRSCFLGYVPAASNRRQGIRLTTRIEATKTFWGAEDSPQSAGDGGCQGPPWTHSTWFGPGSQSNRFWEAQGQYTDTPTWTSHHALGKGTLGLRWP